MGTNAELEPEAPDIREERVRSLIAGHPQGTIRRIGLYVLVFVALVAAMYVPPVAIAGIVPLALLAMTDQLA